MFIIIIIIVLVAEHLQLNLKSILNENQQGFLPGKSIVTNLYQSTQCIQGRVANRLQGDDIF